MIEQLQQNVDHHKQDAQNDKEIKFESTVVFSHIVSCSACGMQMQFVENDVIFGENWYHGKCWKETDGGKHNV